MTVPGQENVATESVGTRQRRLATAQQVAALLGLPLSTLYERARSEPPKIPGTVRIGRLLRFDLDVLEAWIDSGGDISSRSDA